MPPISLRIALLLAYSAPPSKELSSPSHRFVSIKLTGRSPMRIPIAVALLALCPADWTPRGYRLRWRAVGTETALGDLPPAVVC